MYADPELAGSGGGVRWEARAAARRVLPRWGGAGDSDGDIRLGSTEEVGKDGGKVRKGVGDRIEEREGGR